LISDIHPGIIMAFSDAGAVVIVATIPKLVDAEKTSKTELKGLESRIPRGFPVDI
jgi:hypothetical protein